MGKNNKTTIHIVAGPTASGKSAKALELARTQNGVIINCDSLQVYDGLHILTAHPSEEEKAEIPHRFYGTLHPNEVCSAGNWREMVEPIIAEVIANNQTPIICGGTGLYIKALTDGLSPMPDVPDEIRNAVVARHKEIGAEAFYKDLQSRDPIMAERFHANHKARIIRAMEVLESTGKSLAEWQKIPRTPPPSEWEFEIHKVLPDRKILYDRCNKRFEWMLTNNALEEVEIFDKRLQSGEVNDGVPLCKALGFKELRSYINGDFTKEEAIEKSQTRTRQYAKRQMTWLRNQL